MSQQRRWKDRLDEEEVIVGVLDLEGERKRGRRTTCHRGCHGGERRGQGQEGFGVEIETAKGREREGREVRIIGLERERERERKSRIVSGF